MECGQTYLYCGESDVVVSERYRSRPNLIWVVNKSSCRIATRGCREQRWPFNCFGAADQQAVTQQTGQASLPAPKTRAHICRAHICAFIWRQGSLSAPAQAFSDQLGLGVKKSS